MANTRGVTLTELIVVIAIVGILVVALVFSFEGWMGKYKVESQIKEMHIDLVNTRANAMSRTRVHFFRLANATSYTIYADDSNGVIKVPDGDGALQTGVGVGADTQLGGFPKTVEYNMDWNNAAIGAPVDITFSTRGTITTLGTISIFVDRDGDGVRDFEPDYDCIVISQTRINMGQLDGKGTTNRADDECIAK